MIDMHTPFVRLTPIRLQFYSQPISGLFMGPFELLVAAFVIQRFQAALSRDGTSTIRNLIAAKIVKAIKITRVVSCVTRNDGSV